MISPSCEKGEPGETQGWHELCEFKATCACPHHQAVLQYRYPLKKYTQIDGKQALLAGGAYVTPEGWEVIYAVNVLDHQASYENYIYESGRDSDQDGWRID